MEYQPEVTIVILTYNSQETIDRCLHAVKRLDYPQEKLEVVVLDNGSSDRTLQIVAENGFSCRQLPELNLSQLRNYGAEISTGDILAYIDSDCVAAPDWVRQVVKWFTDPSVGIVGNEYLLPEKPSMLERNWYNKSNYGIKYNELIPGGNMAISKKWFEELGGFDDNLLTGEDEYLLKKFRHAGLKTISDHQIHCIHLGNSKNLRQYYSKEIWYGLGMLGTVQFEKLDKPLIATFFFAVAASVSGVLFLLFIFNGAPGLLLSASITLLITAAIPLFAAADRIYRKGIKGNLLYVMLVFLVFFAARLRALTKIATTGYTPHRHRA